MSIVVADLMSVKQETCACTDRSCAFNGLLGCTQGSYNLDNCYMDVDKEQEEIEAVELLMSTL